MSRTVPTNIESALSDPLIIPVVFAQLAFDSGTLYLHSDLGTVITTDTSPHKTWLGVGDFGGISAIEERDDLSPTAIQLRLSGLDATIADEALNQNYFERAVTLYLSLRDTVTGALKDPPFEIFTGFMDDMEVVSGAQTAAIKLTVESELAAFDRAPMRFYTNTQQQDDPAGDLFLQYVNAMATLEIIWGKTGKIRFGSPADTLPIVPGHTPIYA